MQGKSFRWGVAYQIVDNWQNAVLWRSKVIKNPPNRYLADPFVISKDGSHICFVEDYDYLTSKGRITAFKISADSCVELGVALEEPFHLSYPFLFEEAGELFMCPESRMSKEIRLYKCIEFPLRWKLHKVLMSNVSAADTSIFKFGNKWWMLTNIDSSGLDEHCSELHIFHADTCDASDWIPHRSNPVIFDSLRARNGGLVLDGNDIYRVFQVQGFDMYGESMGIAKIKELNAETYAEELLSPIPAKFFSDLKGTHTFSFNKGLLALDFLRIERHNN